VKKTKTGPSTDAGLGSRKMAADHPIVEELLRYRGGRELRNTYGPTPCRPSRRGTGGSTPSSTRRWQVAGADSAGGAERRQFPIGARPEAGSSGGAFMPDEGCELLVADYCRSSLRLLAASPVIRG